MYVNTRARLQASDSARRALSIVLSVTAKRADEATQAVAERTAAETAAVAALAEQEKHRLEVRGLVTCLFDIFSYQSQAETKLAITQRALAQRDAETQYLYESSRAGVFAPLTALQQALVASCAETDELRAEYVCSVCELH